MKHPLAVAVLSIMLAHAPLAIAQVTEPEKEKPAVQEKPAGNEVPITFSFNNGLKFKSTDGNVEGAIGGRLYVGYRTILDRFDAAGAAAAVNPGQPPDTDFIRTARFLYDGTFYKDWYVRVEGEFANTGSFALKDGYMGWKGCPEFGLRGGQMKGPFSQEETCSSRFIDFADRSLANRLSVGHDLGIQAIGSLFNDILGYEIGLFNGGATELKDSGRNTLDLNDEKDFIGRIRITPFKNSDSELLRQLRIGVAFTHGDQDTNALADITTAMSGTRIIDFGAFNLDGNRTRVGVEFSYHYGPFSLRAEYLQLKQELIDGLPENSVTFTATYVQATFLLTGEAKPLENRVKPARNFSFKDGGWGAFELALRYAFIEVRDADTAGVLVVTAPFTPNEKCTEITFGVNWWMTPNVRLTIDFTQYTFGEEMPVSASGVIDELGSEKLVISRLQIDF